MVVPRPARSDEAEIGKIETGRYDTADESRYATMRYGALPYATGHERLRPLAMDEIGPQHHGFGGHRHVAVAAKAKFERTTTVPQP